MDEIKSWNDITMQKDNVIELKKPEGMSDLLTEALRNGARQLLAAAVEAEVDEFLSQHNKGEGKSRFVRNGFLPERSIQTGIGDVAVHPVPGFAPISHISSYAM